ncbi:LPS-assembly protein LptD, partial [bacterium]|nr:LPS-assembly protein LptD [bacterium]
MIAKRYLIRILILTLLGNGSLSALPKQGTVEIAGESVEYNVSTNYLSATDNVIVRYNKYVLKTDELAYDIYSKSLLASGNVKIAAPSQSYEARYISYNAITLEGHADHLSARVGKLSLTGDTMVLADNTVRIKNATLTGCSGDPPDYRIEAEQLILYPKWGVLVAVNNWIYLGNTRLFWMPTFIYGESAYGLLSRSSGIPEIGSSQREGAYLKTRIPYFINRESKGNILAGYAYNFGPILGVTHIEDLPSIGSMQLKLISNGSDGTEYATIMESTFDLSDRTARNDDDSLLSYFARFEDSLRPVIRTKFGSTYREIINDSRVSMLFFQSIDIKKIDLPGNVRGTLFGQHSATVETALNGNSAAARTTVINTELEKQYSITDQVSAYLSGMYYGNWYDASATWQRLFAKIGTVFKYQGGETEISLTQHIYSTVNESPFDFERKYAIESNEIGARTVLNLGEW